MPTLPHQWEKAYRSLGITSAYASRENPSSKFQEARETLSLSNDSDVSAIRQTIDLLSSPEILQALALYHRPRPELVGLSHGNARLPSFVWDDAGTPIGLCNPDSIGVRQLVVDLGQMLRSLCCQGDWRDAGTWRFDRTLFANALHGYNAGLDLVDNGVTELDGLH